MSGTLGHLVRGFVPALLSGFLLIACTDETPARLVFAVDTLVINTVTPTRTGVIARSASGDSLSDAHLGYALPATHIMRLSDDHTITCLDDGDAVVTVTAGSARAMLPVRCHLIRSFGFPQTVELVLGGAPVPLLVDARDKEGRTIQRARMPLIIDDTSVVQLRGGRLVGLKTGHTWLSATDIKTPFPSDRMSVASVSVHELIVNSDTIAIADGDSLVWPLIPGSYILVTAFDAGTSARGVLTSWPGTYCAAVPPAPVHRLQCLVRPEAKSPRLVLRNTALKSGVTTIRGSVLLKRAG